MSTLKANAITSRTGSDPPLVTSAFIWRKNEEKFPLELGPLK